MNATFDVDVDESGHLCVQRRSLPELDATVQVGPSSITS